MMRRSTLIACAGLLVAGCASGADVAADDAAADSAVVDMLDGAPAPPADSASPATP